MINLNEIKARLRQPRSADDQERIDAIALADEVARLRGLGALSGDGAMTEEDLERVRSDIKRPAGKDYDVRCENGSCIKASMLSLHTEDLMEELDRMRAVVAAAREKLGSMLHAQDSVDYARNAQHILPGVLDQWRRARDGALAELVAILQAKV